MRQRAVLAALVMLGIPVLAEGASHKWLKIGQDVQAGKTFSVCVDQNGVQRSTSGRVQFLFSFACPGAGEELEDIFITAGEVDCSQDLSGKTLKTKTLNYREDGAYRWDRAPETGSVSISIVSQSAIWACRQQKR